MNGASVSVSKIEKVFSGAGPQPLKVLRGISFEVQAGESLSVTGPSGSGKSTLLHIIGALDYPTAGSVLIDGRDISALDESSRVEFRNRKAGFIFQSHYLLPQLTVIDNILVPAWNSRRDCEEHIERAYLLLRRVGLSAFAKRLPGQLSGGERQRVAVARALLMRPALVLADEPTGALDRENAAALIELMLEMNCMEKTTLLMVTHSEYCAEKMERRIEILDGMISG